MAVASLVAEHGGSEDEVIAALLHDAIEDQGGQRTADKISELFGREVAEMVIGCSDSFVDASQEQKFPWKQRKVD